MSEKTGEVCKFELNDETSFETLVPYVEGKHETGLPSFVELHDMSPPRYEGDASTVSWFMWDRLEDQAGEDEPCEFMAVYRLRTRPLQLLVNVVAAIKQTKERS
jgi:hypothetical protein